MVDEEQVGGADVAPGPVVPDGVDVVCEYDGSKRARHSITCFRCGEYGHFRSECLTHKTRLCALYEIGECTADAASCGFAHGEDDVRRPWQLKCVRVVRVASRVSVLGCGQIGHTYRMCPFTTGER